MYSKTCGVKLRKSKSPLLLAFVLLMLLSTAWLILNSNVAHADSSNINVNIDHVVTVLDGGQVRLNDTLKLSANQSTSISSFKIGFPYKYKFNIDQVIAYESSNPESKLVLDLDYGLDVAGFYAVKVNFGKDVNLNTGDSYSFTVAYVFSNLITEKIQNQSSVFSLDFPVYPSLSQNVVSCKSTVLLPSNANFTSSSHPFNQTTSGVLSLVKEPLEAFSFEPGNVTFKAIDIFNLLEMTEVKREITINEWEQLLISDSYSLINRALEEGAGISVPVPQGASDVSAQDDLGNNLTVTLENKSTTETVASITLKTAFYQNETIKIKVTFRLPWKNYISQSGLNDFNLNFKLFEPINLTLRKLTVTVILPEGAKFQSSDAATQFNVARNGVYQETLSFTLNNITSFQNPDFTIVYSQMVFWAAFRPTMWTGAIVLIIGAIAFLWQAQAQRGAPTPVTTVLPIRLEELQNYVKAYDERRKLLQERESLEAQARKGKIPRRLYKVRSRTLESRLSVLSRDLANLRDKIRVAGPQYTEMMRQIEVAENDLRGAEADIRRAEASYRRGELSSAAYHQSLEGAYRRRDRAQTNIDGILLRLREETG
jgi:hypothetical protein